MKYDRLVLGINLVVTLATCCNLPVLAQADARATSKNTPNPKGASEQEKRALAKLKNDIEELFNKPAKKMEEEGKYDAAALILSGAIQRIKSESFDTSESKHEANFQLFFTRVAITANLLDSKKFAQALQNDLDSAEEQLTLGEPELASAALEQAGDNLIRTKNYEEARKVFHRYLKLARGDGWKEAQVGIFKACLLLSSKKLLDEEIRNAKAIHSASEVWVQLRKARKSLIYNPPSSEDTQLLDSLFAGINDKRCPECGSDEDVIFTDGDTPGQWWCKKDKVEF